jgi:hypothetical protein
MKKGSRSQRSPKRVAKAGHNDSRLFAYLGARRAKACSFCWNLRPKVTKRANS